MNIILPERLNCQLCHLISSPRKDEITGKYSKKFSANSINDVDVVELDVIVAIPDRYNDLSDEDVGDLASDSFLVNGRGRYNNNKAPLSVHKVQAGDKYMFRIINVGFDNMFEVGI